MSRALLSALAVVCCIGLSSAWVSSSDATKRSYDGYTVVRSIPQTPSQLEHLQELMSKTEESGDETLQFWTEPRGLNASVDVMVDPNHFDRYMDKLESLNIPSEELISDVGQEIRRTKTGPDFSGLTRQHIIANESLRAQISTQKYYNQYQRYSAIEIKLQELAELDPRVKLEVIGKSTERRNLYLVKVSSDHAAKKPVILLDAGHHAREWVSHSTIMYLLESLVIVDMPRVSTRQCRSQQCRQVTAQRPKLDLEKFDYWFIPVVNPDGYEYSHTYDRLWRKTRSFGSYCPGVDPNRNYDFHWQESGSSTIACSQIYAGPYAASEPEVRAVTSVMDDNKGRIKSYLTLHSYSQMLLAPYGYARVRAKNYRELEDAANSFIESLRRLRDTEYQFGPTAVLLYPAAGGSDDYAHGKANIRYSYTIELPDKGRNGFVLPNSEIIPVAHETLIGLQAMIERFR